MSQILEIRGGPGSTWMPIKSNWKNRPDNFPEQFSYDLEGYRAYVESRGFETRMADAEDPTCHHCGQRILR